MYVVQWAIAAFHKTALSFRKKTQRNSFERVENTLIFSNYNPP